MVKQHVVLGALLIGGGWAQADPRHRAQAKVIELGHDIVHEGKGSPFIASETFGVYGPEKLVITSDSAKALILKKDSTWDLTSFSSSYKIIEFAGNARLVCESGSQLQGNGGVLRFVDEARLIVGEE